MKKWFLVGMLVTGLMGFAKDRFVEKCEITSKGVYKNGTRYVNCISRATGRHFNFINVKEIVMYYLPSQPRFSALRISSVSSGRL